MVAGFLKDVLPQVDAVVRYTLLLSPASAAERLSWAEEAKICLNDHLGQPLRLSHNGEKACVLCGRRVSKLFANGSCYPCFRDRPENDLCVVKPHQCHYETCRDQAWGDRHCMVSTYVYIARSSDVKVGISRNIPGRWAEQGAVEAVPIALLPTRRLAGELEIFLSQHLPDKTDWRKMLRGEVVDTPLEDVKRRVLALVPPEFRAFLLPGEPAPMRLVYPGENGPEKIKSQDLDKGPAEGRLLGIKGRYLILSEGVVNLAKYVGYHIVFEAF